MAKLRIIPFPEKPGQTPEQINVHRLSLTRNGRAILNGFDLSLPATGVTALIGPNGAGKSIFLKVLAGIINADSGQVYLPNSLKTPALVFQKPVLLRRSVRANLIHALKIAGIARRARPGRVAELMVRAGLTSRSEAPARALSGGEQQRLAIVRALAFSPRLLLLDEPTASLDPAATAQIEDLIGEISGQGVKIILVTHDRAQARRLADDIVFLHQGEVMEAGPTQAFFSTPGSKEARAYLSGELLV